jgi:ankyrin repeat protein
VEAALVSGNHDVVTLLLRHNAKQLLAKGQGGQTAAAAASTAGDKDGMHAMLAAGSPHDLAMFLRAGQLRVADHAQ